MQEQQRTHHTYEDLRQTCHHNHSFRHILNIYSHTTNFYIQTDLKNSDCHLGCLHYNLKSIDEKVETLSGNFLISACDAVLPSSWDNCPDQMNTLRVYIKSGIFATVRLHI